MGYMSRGAVLALVFLLASKVSSPAWAQETETASIFAAPKILVSGVSFPESIPENDLEAFEAEFAALIESLSDGAIDGANVTLSSFAITPEDHTSLEMEIYFENPDDAFKAKNLLRAPQIGGDFEPLGAGRAVFNEVRVYEASDMSNDDELIVTIVLGVLCGMVALLCVANLIVFTCLCIRRRKYKKLAQAAAPIPKPESPKEGLVQKRSFSFGLRKSKVTDGAEEPADKKKPAMAKRGWFGRKKGDLHAADGEASAPEQPAEQQKPEKAKRSWFGGKKGGSHAADEEAPASDPASPTPDASSTPASPPPAESPAP